jgi:hypothetical protein
MKEGEIDIYVELDTEKGEGGREGSRSGERKS